MAAHNRVFHRVELKQIYNFGLYVQDDICKLIYWISPQIFLHLKKKYHEHIRTSGKHYSKDSPYEGR